jgi:hypothetical protein
MDAAILINGISHSRLSSHSIRTARKQNMPKDPKRNIQSYQLEGGHLNEYKFQKSQSEMAQESELLINDETGKPNLAQATKRLAEVTAQAHGIVEKRKKRGLVKAGGQKSIAAGKRSAKKVATKSTKKTTKRAGTKKRPSVKTRRQKRASTR